MTDEELIAGLRGVCDCNIDSTPCCAESECRDAMAAADRIEALVKESDVLISQHAVMMMERDAARFELEDAEAEVEKLRGALHNCVGMLDCLVAESGRSIEWGQEDPFRMGEWFEPDDLKQLEQARAALKGTDHE